MPTIGFPLLLIPLALYNIIVFLMPDVAFTAPLVTVPLPSAATWTVTLGDVLLALGIILLLFEMVRAARPGAKYFTDHLLSLLVFGGAAAEFALLKQFATSTFFLLTLLAAVDFLGGTSIALRWRKLRRASVAPATAPAPTAPSPAEPPPPATSSRVEPVIEQPAPAKPVAPEPAPASPPQAPQPVTPPAQDNAPSAAEPPKPADKISNWNVAEIVSGVDPSADKASPSQPAKDPHPVDPPKPSDKV
jgi:outer membrane biosynthesis protein TonB